MNWSDRFISDNQDIVFCLRELNGRLESLEKQVEGLSRDAELRVHHTPGGVIASEKCKVCIPDSNSTVAICEICKMPLITPIASGR